MCNDEPAPYTSNFPTHFRTKETADLFLALIIRLLEAVLQEALALGEAA